MLRSVLLTLACVLVTVYCACTDGQDNVCGIGDDSNGLFGKFMNYLVLHACNLGALNIELNNMVGWTYDSNNAATCKGSEAALTMPGVIKLVQGRLYWRCCLILISSILKARSQYELHLVWLRMESPFSLPRRTRWLVPRILFFSKFVSFSWLELCATTVKARMRLCLILIGQFFNNYHLVW